MFPVWVCGFVGVVVGFGSIEGGFVGIVAGVGVWVCWWCCQRGCVGMLVLVLDLGLLKVVLLVVLPA